MYSLDILIPTARFVFAVEDGRVEVDPEHRSPEAFGVYRRWQRERLVVGMTTFPNTLLLRGPRTVVVDPGLHLQNAPVLGALLERGLAPADVELIVLTHAHLDHAGACADLPGRVVVHERELDDPGWAAVAGVLRRDRLTLLSGECGEVAPGITWSLTPGHSLGSICLRVETGDGVTAVAGDTVGPLVEHFERMQPADGTPQAGQLLAAWRQIRSWRPTQVVAGHLPPFTPGD